MQGIRDGVLFYGTGQGMTEGNTGSRGICRAAAGSLQPCLLIRPCQGQANHLRPLASRGIKRPTTIMNICQTSRKLMAMTAAVGMMHNQKDCSGKR